MTVPARKPASRAGAPRQAAGAVVRPLEKS